MVIQSCSEVVFPVDGNESPQGRGDELLAEGLGPGEHLLEVLQHHSQSPLGTWKRYTGMPGCCVLANTPAWLKLRQKSRWAEGQMCQSDFRLQSLKIVHS